MKGEPICIPREDPGYRFETPERRPSPGLGPRGRRHPRLLPRTRRRPGRGVGEGKHTSRYTKELGRGQWNEVARIDRYRVRKVGKGARVRVQSAGLSGVLVRGGSSATPNSVHPTS